MLQSKISSVFAAAVISRQIKCFSIASNPGGFKSEDKKHRTSLRQSFQPFSITYPRKFKHTATMGNLEIILFFA